MEKTPSELWSSVVGELEVSTKSSANFNAWIKTANALELKDGCLILGFPTKFHLERFTDYFKKEAKEIIHRISKGEVADFSCQILTQKSQEAPLEGLFANITIDKPQLKSKERNSTIKSKYTFESFVVGSNNQLAHAAAEACSLKPGEAYNPLFIYSGVGLGKTHLVQSVGNEAVKIGKKVKYVTSEKFTSEVVNAITNNEMDQFKNKYRQTDVLIVDDIQFLSGKERTQEEFFHTFNSLYENNKQIILTSDRLPKAIPTLTERLRSRFEGGMIADISEPDQETRMAILRNKSREKEVEISEDIITFIAQNIQKNIRELEGALNRIIAFCRSKGVNPSLESAKSVLAALLAAPKKNITPKNIIQTVADFYDIQEKELIRKNRRQEVVKPRQIAMFLLREELKSSYPFIGQKLGGRDHTTAIHACEKISQEIKTNSSLQDEIKLILEKIYNKM